MTYTLLQLILFFKFQSETDYKVIERILELIDSKDIPEDDKKELILFELRNNGLVDREHDEMLTRMLKPKMEEEMRKRLAKRGFEICSEETLIPLDIHKIRLLNITVKFMVVLN